MVVAEEEKVEPEETALQEEIIIVVAMEQELQIITKMEQI